MVSFKLHPSFILFLLKYYPQSQIFKHCCCLCSLIGDVKRINISPPCLTVLLLNIIFVSASFLLLCSCDSSLLYGALSFPQTTAFLSLSISSNLQIPWHFHSSMSISQLSFITSIPYTFSFSSFTPHVMLLSLPFPQPVLSLSFLPALFTLTCLCKTAACEINYHCCYISYIWLHGAIFLLLSFWCVTVHLNIEM